MKDQKLTVEIVNDELVIRIGIDTLAGAAIMGPYFQNLVETAADNPDTVKVTNNLAFAESIVSALKEESEDGTTMVHQMLDSAAEYVSENGLDGLSVDGE